MGKQYLWVSNMYGKETLVWGEFTSLIVYFNKLVLKNIMNHAKVSCASTRQNWIVAVQTTKYGMWKYLLKGFYFEDFV